MIEKTRVVPWGKKHTQLVWLFFLPFMCLDFVSDVLLEKGVFADFCVHVL